VGVLAVYDPAHGIGVEVDFVHIVMGCAHHVVKEFYSAPAALPAGGDPNHMIDPVLPPESAGNNFAPCEVADHFYPFSQFLQNSPPAVPIEGKIVYISLLVKDLSPVNPGKGCRPQGEI